MQNNHYSKYIVINYEKQIFMLVQEFKILKNFIQWKLCIMRFLGWRNFVCCYIRYLVISVVNKQYKTKEINSLGPEKLVCYIRYFVISDLFISSFHCIQNIYWRVVRLSYLMFGKMFHEKVQNFKLS